MGLGLPFGRTIEQKPETKTPNRPKRIRKWAGLANGPASRPSAMWMEMSQYIPTTATISETAVIAEGSAAHGGRPLRSEA